MRPTDRTAVRFRNRSEAFRLRSSAPRLLLALLLLGTACIPQQEREQLIDTEPERLINTDLSYPKNLARWAFVTSRAVTTSDDPMPGYRIVLLNPFGARAREEAEAVSRGAKFAQLIYEPLQDATGIRPGALRRLNVLVQDPARYAATGGWGYASYDANGHPIPIEPQMDCLPCHRNGPVSLDWPGESASRAARGSE